MTPSVGRRALLRLLLGTALSLPALRRAPGQPNDRGIGGTGYAPGDDRGIGGTGVIGTIRKFGSIVVNDLRIAYAPDVNVRIDGRPAAPADLKLGQVVRVTARNTDGDYSTRTIDVTSEVVGPVESVGGKQMVVLGQVVSTESLAVPHLAAGDVVAISGLRRNDGTIVASLVEPRPAASSRVAGPVTLGAGGVPAIGALPLVGASPDLVGRRAIVEGVSSGGRFEVSRSTVESTLFPRGVRNLSVESYVQRRDGSVSLGSGFRVTGAEKLDFSSDRSVRAVVTATVTAQGRLAIDSVQAGGRTYGVPSVGPHGVPPGSKGPGSQAKGGKGSRSRGPGGHGPDGHGPGGRRPGGQGPGGQAPGGRGPIDGGGRGPMDFGRDNRGPGGFGGPGGGGPGGGPGGSGMGGGAPGGGGPGGGGMGGGRRR